MNFYRLGLIGMLLTLLLCLTAIYFIFITELTISLPWIMFWHFTLLLMGLAFKLFYVMILASAPKKKTVA